MDYISTYSIILSTSIFIALLVAIAGCTVLKPQRLLKIVFPYIKISGSNIVIFDFVIPNISIFLHYIYVIYVVQEILFVALFNTFFTSSDTYNPYDGLDCIAYYNNGSQTKLVSEKEVDQELENVARIRCLGLKFDITRGIGHAAAIVTLSWIYASIVLWVKLNLYYKLKNSKNQKCSQIGLLTIHLIQVTIFLGSLAAFPISVFQLNEILLPDQILDIGLVCTILISGLPVFPSHKKPKSLAEYCKEVVEDNKWSEEGALVEIKNDHGHQVDVDALVELAKSECQEALAKNNLNEAEMNIIVQVAYDRIIEVSSTSNRNSADSVQSPIATEQSTEQASNTGNTSTECEVKDRNTSSQEHQSIDQEADRSTDSESNSLLGSTK